jgi:hypothetical protein
LKVTTAGTPPPALAAAGANAPTTRRAQAETSRTRARRVRNLNLTSNLLKVCLPPGRPGDLLHWNWVVSLGIG